MIFLTSGLISQNVTVQSFDYNSETRDTVISFPDIDHNNWERIEMHYSMRCKDGLVSPPISGQTNIGCGEWDYSCNTYITDSTKIDSLFRVSPDFEISNFSGSEFDYSVNPTYTYYQSTLKDVTVSSVSNENTFSMQNSDQSLDVMSGNDLQRRFLFEWTDDELEAVGLTAGALNGLSFDVLSGAGEFKNLKVRMRNGIDGSKACFTHDDWVEVYYNNKQLNTSENKLIFYQDFNWNGNDNLQADISYEIVNSDLSLGASASSATNLDVATNNGVWRCDGQSNIKLTGDFSSISTQITISFWSKGASGLPQNTFFLEGVDQDNNRQVNIHLPWSNSQVYWDCGNVGNGYDRINRLAQDIDYKDRWNHWTFSKNTTSGEMTIHLNGALWHAGTGLSRPIDLDTLVIGSSSTGNTPYLGDIDDLKIWDRQLSLVEILENYCGSTTSTDDNLILHYDFNDLNPNSLIEDLSSSNNDGEINGSYFSYPDFPRDFKLYETREAMRPSIDLLKGDYDLMVNDVVVLDSLTNAQHLVDEYILDGTDRILGSSNTYYPAGEMPIYDEAGNLVGNKTTLIDGTISIGEMEHFTKTPMQFEIMSFVTPYGINLDLGWEGKTWVFDVTDFGPILKGDKRIYLTRGGQWQEDMDIKFVFIEGTPIRDVNSITQIWPVTSTGFQAILDDTRFEPRPLVRSIEDHSVQVKTVVTGHGQEGEFIPRTHFVAIDGVPLPWQVWKECAQNPVYPQGGTWVYDRAGWCPGMASDQKIHDFTGIMQTDVPALIDYGINSVSGNSRYIVSSQAVKYGAPNHGLDVALHDILYPTKYVEHARFNPNCSQPRIAIQNRGSENLTSCTIKYGIVGGQEFEKTWEGNLSFMGVSEFHLDYLPLLANSEQEETFYAEVTLPNGENTDEYNNNNRMESIYEPVDMLEDEIVINLKTNNSPIENGYILYDEYDQVVASRQGSGLSANTIYVDTISNLNGCYRFVFTDSGQDGLEFFANPGQGSGNIRLKSINGSYLSFDPDFGAFLEYHFVAGMVSNVEDQLAEEAEIEVYPNPSSDLFNVFVDGNDDIHAIEVFDQNGRLLQRFRYQNKNHIYQEIDLSAYANGLYLLNIVGYKRYTRRLLKI